MTNFTLIRHTKVQNPSVCYGQMDVVLDDIDFKESVLNLKKELGDLSTIYSSPSKRCLVLANALCKNVIIIDDLLEMNFGDWQGLTWGDIDRKQIDDWAKDVQHYQPPQGESCQQFFLRAKKGLQTLPNNAIVITHAGIIRASQYWYTQQNFELASQFTVEHAHSYTINTKNNNKFAT
ncbi:MAG: histidine phosphatase family protein [Saccharospirillaceae bacterium]|nr:histidine phosphatase family protein [Pseudomonadales bacterium]NRB79555.1 histidine phosphatase family protein [Saccharospirillaceae bacterium]